MMTIRLFGAFRNLQSEPEISIDASGAKTVGELRAILARQFAGASFDAVGLLAKSAIANDREVLNDESPVSDRLALLPPVSGG
jgi:molybdopterin converting factor small subunit